MTKLINQICCLIPSLFFPIWNHDTFVVLILSVSRRHLHHRLKLMRSSVEIGGSHTTTPQPNPSPLHRFALVTIYFCADFGTVCGEFNADNRAVWFRVLPSVIIHAL